MSDELEKIIQSQAETIAFLRAELKAERNKCGDDVLIFHRQPSARSIYSAPDTFFVTTAISMSEAERQSDGGDTMANVLALKMADHIKEELRCRKAIRTQTESPESFDQEA